MRRLNKVLEFKEEAAQALFTKQQAISVTLRLLEMERDNPQNSADDRRVLETALEKAEFRYIDATRTDTDRLLDACGVARITTQDIASAIDNLIFDAQ